MPHVVLGGKLHPSGPALLDRLSGYTVTAIDAVTTASLLPAVLEADAVVLRTQLFHEDLIDRCKNLRIVSRHGVGYDSIDVAALARRGIPVTVVGDVNSGTVAEHAMTLMLAASKRLLRYDAAARGDGWGYRDSLESTELAGKTLLIIGFGRIGRKLARMAQAFDMSVLVFDPFLSGGASVGGGVTFVGDFNEALRRTDVVSIHVPKTDRPILGPAELALMKPTAIVINTARGGAVDETALADALTAGRLGAAGIDVFIDEPPLIERHPLATCDRAILTPHCAGLTRECAERMSVASVQNIIDFFNDTLDRSLIVNGVDIAGPGSL